MSRIAVVIANSVTGQPTQRGLGVPKVKRTAEQVASLLEGLPDKYRFEPMLAVDAKPEAVLRMLDKAAASCTGSNSVLLVYYFGHGRREGDNLAFVHPGRRKAEAAILPFQSMFHRVLSANPTQVVFLLDCCYAGAAGKDVARLPQLEPKCCLLACTAASTRALWEAHQDTPIGYFTSALLDGLSGPGGAISPADDRVTIDSLFSYVHQETIRLTDNKQEPYMAGRISGVLSMYSAAPVILEGVSTNVSVKSAYSKLRAIISTLRVRNYPDAHTLYQSVLSRHRKAFLTNYMDASGRIVQRPAQWTVLRKYLSFLRMVSVLDSSELRLGPRGVELADTPDRYNAVLLRLIDRCLGNNGLSRDDLKVAMQRVLQRRWMPTRNSVLNEIMLMKRPAISEQQLVLVLDLLGNIGVIGTLGRKEQVYFPWGSRPA